VYLLVVSRLPNHIYYAHIASMDDERLYRNVRNVILYSTLELLSFLILQHFIKKRLQLSASLQLAFVLESQWEMVQSKLVLWVVYIVQASLVHFGTLKVSVHFLSPQRLTRTAHCVGGMRVTTGVDYTFQFEWLRAKTQSN